MQQIEEFAKPQRINCEIGKRYSKMMPASEVCMCMKVTDRILEAELLGPKGDYVQLYKNGQIFSSPITASEAGFYWDDELQCRYFYQEV